MKRIYHRTVTVAQRSGSPGERIRLRLPNSPLFLHLLAGAATFLAGSQALQFNVVYNCSSPGSQKIKILSCTGSSDDAMCEVQSYSGSEAGTRAHSARKAVLISIAHCRPQSRPAARASVPPTPAGQPPKPGLTSCSGKIDGMYSSPSGYPSIVFHSGKASVEGDEAVECWMGGGKIYLHTTGARADQDFVMAINNDGTLDTPLGEIRKKGN